jgi:hypothetical protein
MLFPFDHNIVLICAVPVPVAVAANPSQLSHGAFD